MRVILSSLCGLGLTAAAAAQFESVIPPACATLPGNAATSLPLRWSYGTLQVRIDAGLLPASFLGKTISGLRLRRPAFLGEPAYGVLQRTLTLRGGFDNRPARNLTIDLAYNRPANCPILFGPAPVTVAATPPQGAAMGVGPDLLAIQFSTPLPVIAGTLFLEFEAGDPPFQVLSEHWVDAVWFEDGVENGYAVTVGAGSCTTRPVPTELRWNDPATGPAVGGTASLLLTGAPPHATGAPGTLAFLWFGLDPEPRAVAAGYVGFGGSLGALDPTLAGCHQWAPLDAVIVGTVGISGSYNGSFALTSGVTTIGMRLGVQGAWLDTSRPGLPLSISNGLLLVLDRIDVGNKCASQYFPDGATTAPWFRLLGQMPVIVLEHD
jgi:hypothetical protein